ncbi:MAG: hypothetical protein Q8O41_05695 [Candidatus Methanoperedens sp.]|nr:hypothetical protein [Candidatus Methanoperedens sp.]
MTETETEKEGFGELLNSPFQDLPSVLSQVRRWTRTASREAR